MKNYCLLFLFVCSLIFPFSVVAVEIAPTGYHFTVEPNSSESMSIEVTNTSETSQTYVFSVVDEENISQISDIAQWFTLPKAITIAPLTQQTVDLSFFVPPTAIPGDRYTYILVQEQAEDNPVTVQSEVGIPTTITVAGEMTESVILQSIDIVREKGQVMAHATIKNTGNIAVPVRGTFLLSNNQQTYEIPFDIELHAGAVHSIDMTKDIPLWFVGEYDAQLQASYGLFERPVQGYTTTYIVSSAFIFAVIIGILIVVVVSSFFILKKKRRYEDEV